jgi:predicted nucleic acid-binding protein
MLTDTTFWIDLEEERARGRLGPAHRLLAKNRNNPLKVSVITWGELAAGVDSPAALHRLLNRVRVLSLPTQVAWEASRIDREMSPIGARLGENDNWIAATARSWGLPLVSRDKSFQRVPRLRVVTY